MNLDVCTTCDGVWFNQDELGRVINSQESAVSSELQEQWVADADQEANPAGKHCPECAEGLKPYYYQYSSRIELDRCPNQHGLWLDDGELKKVYAYLLESRQELTPEQKAEIQPKLDAIRASVEDWDKKLDDSLVQMDDKPGIMRFPGQVLQFIYSGFSKLDD